MLRRKCNFQCAAAATLQVFSKVHFESQDDQPHLLELSSPISHHLHLLLLRTIYSFQNPGTTSVKLNMESPKMTQILVSQNVPYNSPMDVTINDPVDNHIHCSQVLGLSYSWIQYFQSVFQSASKGSPMTVTINGDNVEETNQIEVAQNAADDESTLTCVPDCPQEDYVYDYQVGLCTNPSPMLHK